nr:MAG TPA: hypothetical protein [Caudoviricetes sp.]
MISIVILCDCLCGVMLDCMSMYCSILYSILEVYYNSNIMWYMSV